MEMEEVSRTRMKILVIGVTSPMGLLIITEALTRGYDVIALARNPEKITVLNPRLQVFEADIFDHESIAQHLQGCKAVLSGVEVMPKLITPCNVYSKSCEAVVKAMRAKGVKRFILITSWSVREDRKVPYLWKWAVKTFLFFMKDIFEDMGECEYYLDEHCRDLHYTVVKPFHLTNSPSQGLQIIARDGQFCWDIQPQICRQDLAKFMLNNIAQHAYYKKFLCVGHPY
ncbi:flavin reductase (NADPH) [Biomphalaria pfeifferi]|uniref:Flavin reductase (NADPH) n=1 Tax=Biomphalaria pfeifferi TaxID=112525 RepID=A0AAD8BS26_BIOPF|nr:flavin reductase (NADPH) [Biomphalaria pfeifferi]